MAVINPPERKLAKRTSVQWLDQKVSFVIFALFFGLWTNLHHKTLPIHCAGRVKHRKLTQDTFWPLIWFFQDSEIFKNPEILPQKLPKPPKIIYRVSNAPSPLKSLTSIHPFLGVKVENI
jgi:hypothetical protein